MFILTFDGNDTMCTKYNTITAGMQQSLEIWGGQVVMQSKILTSVSYKVPSDLPKSGGAAAPPPLLHPCIDTTYLVCTCMGTYKIYPERFDKVLT